MRSRIMFSNPAYLVVYVVFPRPWFCYALPRSHE